MNWEVDGSGKSNFPLRRSELGTGWYTAGELANMRLPGYKITSRAMRNRLEREGWEHRDVIGRGPHGVERVYRPPEHVLAMIEARSRPMPAQVQRPAVAEERPVYAVPQDWQAVIAAAETRVGYALPGPLRQVLILALMHGMSESVLDAQIELIRAQRLLDKDNARSFD